MGQTNKCSLPDLVAQVGKYPIDAFLFVQRGLQYTAEKLHGPAPRIDPTDFAAVEAAEAAEAMEAVERDRHVTGQDLSHGLRDLAKEQWGRMAGAVLRQWNITGTGDFGQIVFALVNAEHMRKKPEDSIEDFNNVYDFAQAFEEKYEIDLKRG